MDRYIPPIVISDSDAGITRGRTHILKDNGLDLIEVRIVDEATVKRLTALIIATSADDAKQARSWGAVQFTVLFPSSERAVILGKAHAIALLESLSASTNDADLRGDLKEFLDHERSLANFNARPSESLVAGRFRRREQGPSGPRTTALPGLSASG
jgi:hypothetical protein